MLSAKVTGIGPISICGAGHPALWRGLTGEQSYIRTVSRFDPSSHVSKVGGQIPDDLIDQFIPSRQKRTATHVTQLGLCAASLCLRDANLSGNPLRDTGAGVFTGTALGGWTQGEQQYSIFLERGSRRVNPFLVSGAGNHGAGIEIASLLNATGPQMTFSTGCVSGLQAIAYGASLIAHGDLTIGIAGGAESPLSPLVMGALSRTGELSTQNEHPENASRPFDRSHDGMVLSEGACFFVLESDEHARERGARVYAEILGGVSSCDARGLYHFDESGEAGARAIHQLLRRTGVTPDQIDYVCAHANSSPAFDRKEVVVLKRAFGEFAAKIPVSSIKGALGHPFGAAGALQTAGAVLAMEHSLIPHTHNLIEPAPECDLDLVLGEPRPATVRHALVTSYGYGGVNSYLLLRNPNV